MCAFRALLVFLLSAAPALSATFGTPVQHPSPLVDLAYDSGRNRLYVLSPLSNTLEVYNTAGRSIAPLKTITVDTNPISMAMSRPAANGVSRYLYVACYTGGVIDQIDLTTLAKTNTITLPANPEAVAIGYDDKLLISTIGSPQGQFVLTTYDPNAAGAANALQSITVAPPAPAAPIVPPPNGLPFLAVRAQLVATPDGQTIIGVHQPPGNSRTIFVYQVSSATVLRSRSVGLATGVLAVSADGSRFLSGHFLFDTASLAVIAQQNTTNSPFLFTPGANFNNQAAQGGAAFLPDGSALLTAYNIVPLAVPAAQSNTAQLLVNTPDNLLIQLGLQLPQNLAGKMVITPDGATAFALSTSGLMVLPLSTLKPGAAGAPPIAIPDSKVALVTSDQCGVFAGRNSAVVPVRNIGGSSLSVSAQIVTASPNSAALRTAAKPYGTDVTATFNSAVARSTLGTATPDQVLLQSAQAVNIIPAVRVFQNFRNSETPGTVIPVDIGATATGLTDIVEDTVRQRLYIANPGLNHIEVFDIAGNAFLAPINVGQLPRSLALSSDGNSLYVANSGGENLSLVHLNADISKVKVETIQFPPLPFNSALGLITPQLVASSQRDPQVLMSDGTMWKIAGNTVTLRKLNPNIFGTANSIPGPQTMISTPEGSYVLVLGGQGSAFLYSAAADDIIAGRQVISPPITGYFGAVAAGPNGQYYLAGPQILDSALTLVGSAPGSGGPVIPGGPAGGRPVAALAAMGAQTFARFSTPIRTSLTVPGSDAGIIELVDANTQRTLASIAVPEGPPTAIAAFGRSNVNGRQMAVDVARSTVYAITASGLSVIPVNVTPAAIPQLNGGGIVNTANFQNKVAAGGLISIFGRNLAAGATASGTPLPTTLGGTCVTLSNTPIPLLSTAGGQINAQLPPALAAGSYTLVIRSVDNQAASTPATMAVARYAPAIFVDQNGPAIFHQNGTRVDKEHPANRDEPLTIYATGLGPTTGGPVTAGSPSPSSPLAVTGAVKVYFGNPSISNSGVVVKWSGLAPGLIGVYQINGFVPGNHLSGRGQPLPVTLRVGGVSSPTTGANVPLVYVN